MVLRAKAFAQEAPSLWNTLIHFYFAKNSLYHLLGLMDVN